MGEKYSQSRNVEVGSSGHTVSAEETAPSLGFSYMKPELPTFDTDWLAGGGDNSVTLNFAPPTDGRVNRLSPTEIAEKLREERRKTARLRERQRVREQGDNRKSSTKTESKSDVEIDASRAFFCEPEDAVVIEECAPRLDNDEFIRRKEAVSFTLSKYIQPLITHIEAQTALLIEKDLELKRMGRELKLLPDFQKQARERDEEFKLKHFESLALRKQIEQLEFEQVMAEKVTKLSNSIIRSVEKKAEDMQTKMQAELEETRREAREKSEKDEEYIESLRREVSQLRQPWWVKLFSYK